jgi:type I restriction enzyme M protein
MPATLTEIERRLWHAADELRANSKLKASEYSFPVLGLIFLRYANYRFEQVDQKLKAAQATSRRPLPLSKARYQAEGVLYIPDEARFSRLL